MAALPSTREAILEAFRGLPLHEQRVVADAVNQEIQTAESAEAVVDQQETVSPDTMSREPRPAQPGWVGWRQLAGLFANGQEPPSDAQVQQWLEEARMEKYGG